MLIEAIQMMYRADLCTVFILIALLFGLGVERAIGQEEPFEPDSSRRSCVERRTVNPQVRDKNEKPL